MPIQDRIRKPEAIKQIAGCIYAKSGMGKTTLLGTIPGRGLVLDVPIVEGGTFVLTGEAGRIDVLEIKKWDELQEVFVFLRDGKHEYKWVAIDTITATQELAKRKLIREREISSDPHKITQPEWGQIGSLNGELVWKFRSLPIHTIMVAQEKIRGSEDSGGKEWVPDISPASLSAILPPMTLVGRLFIEETINAEGISVWERRLWVGPNSSYVTKTRAMPGRTLPPIIKNPNLGQIFAYLLGLDVPAPEGVEQGLIAIG